MAESTTYQCPNCEGRLVFDGPSGKLVCEFCDSAFDPIQIEQLYAAEQSQNDSAAKNATAAASALGEETATSPDTPTDEAAASVAPVAESGVPANQDPVQTYINSTKWDASEAETLRSLNCSSCGAQLFADQATAVTRCPYCGNTAVVPGQLTDVLRPDYVIPFKLDKETAKRTLKQYYANKKLLPNSFANENHIEEIQGVYVPFWLYSGHADASLQTQAHNTRVWADSKNNYAATDHFAVYREGSMDFDRVPVDGSFRMPDAHMDSIEPFNYVEMVPFSVGYLPGFVADRYDVDVDDCRGRAQRRIEATCGQALMDSVVGYESVDSRPATVSLHLDEIAYALLPVWMLHTRWNNQDFLFAMNGQTGRLIGDLPVDKGKAARRFFAWYAAIAAVLAIIVFCIVGLFGGTSKEVVYDDIARPDFTDWGAAGASPNTFIYDLYGLFDDKQESELTSRAQQLAREYDMGVYLLTTSYMDGLANPTSSQRTNYATTFYKDHALGLGEGHSGIMLVIAVTSRDYVTIAYGGGWYEFNDQGIEAMEDAVTSKLADDLWFEGATAYYDQIGTQLAYFNEHGEPGQPWGPLDWALRLLIVLGVPLPIAGLIIFTQVKSMRPVRERTEATEYLDRNSLAIAAANDTFINTTVIATPRAESSGSSGGGGGWGGGGGGSFSSSGGGKF